MLKIRLQRVGRKNNPAFRIVVTDSKRGPKSGDNVELIGSYNPHSNEIQIDGDRVKHWMSVGAQVSDTMHNLLIREKIIEGKKINVLPKKSPIVKEITEEEKKAQEAKAEADAEVPSESGKEAPAETKTEEPEEKTEETKEEAPVEAKEEETPKEETKEEPETPKEEVKEETPKEEAKEKPEAPKEETKEEVKAEA